MCRKTIWHLVASVCCCLVGTSVWGQSDCPEAIVICDDGVIEFAPELFTAEDDFANPNNDPGCLQTLEIRNVWYYFSFRSDMPPDSEIEFTLVPTNLAGDLLEFVDYDFAIYGPDLPCDSLGSPLRCSYARFDTTPNCVDCNDTGLGMGATDLSEGAVNTDGFVAPLVVQPGQGFYLLIDNFVGDTDAFSLTWGGSAAPFLNCITEPACSELTLVTAPQATLCGDVVDFPLLPTVTGADDAMTFSWSGDDLQFLDDTLSLTPSVTLPAGLEDTLEFTLTVEQNGCSQTGSFSLVVTGDAAPALLPATIPAVCPGDSLDITLQSGFTSYRWSTGDTTQTLRVAANQLYTVTATLPSGCQVADAIDVQEQPRPDFAINGTPTFCAGSSTLLTATPGFAAYRWSNDEVSNALTITEPGNYGLTVTDANGCSWDTTQVVEELPLPVFAIAGEAEICADENSVLAVADDFMTYLWSTGAATNTIEADSTGTYAVTVTGDSGCSDVGQFDLIVHDLPVITGEAVAFCPGTTTTLTAPAGYASYLWSTTEPTSTIEIDAVADYGLTVTDEHGCEGTTVYEAQNHTLSPVAIAGEPAFCAGSSTMLTATPGFALYDWDTGSNTATAVIDDPGTVNVEVTDANGCVQSTSLAVEELPLPDFTITGQDEICADATTTLSVAGAFAHYSWSTGDDAPSIVADSSGTYVVTVTAANGCSDVGQFDLTVHPLPSLAPAAETFCPDESAILIAPTGFADYQWSTTEQTNTIEVSQADDYGLTVTDNNGCTGETTYSVTAHTVLPVAIAGEIEFCAGAGTVLTASAGFTSYQWSTGSDTPMALVGAAGPISVEVTDENGCTQVETLELTEFPLPDPTLDVNPVICGGESLVVSLDAAYAEYAWSTGSEQATITTGVVGDYDVTVTDANGCTEVLGFSVSAFPAFDLSIDGAEEICATTENTLTATPGLASYTWSTGAATNEISATDPGLYSVIAEDANGCVDTATFSFTVFPDMPPTLPATAYFCSDSSTLVTVEGLFPSVLWSTGSVAPTIEIMEPGNYTVEVADTNGCVYTAAIDVDEQPVPDIELISPDALCEGTPTAITVTEGFPVYVWSDGSNEPNLVIDQGGEYSVTVTDALGCSAMLTTFVGSLESPELALIAPPGICPDENAILATEGEFATYLWSTDAAAPSISVNTPGTYTLTVTDENGCTATETVDLLEWELPQLDLTGATAFCAGSNTLLTAEGDFATVQWPDGTTEENWTADIAGEYVVTAVSEEGCATTADLTLTENALPTFVFTEFDPLDCSTTAVTLSVTDAPGDALTYTWTGPAITAANANNPTPTVDEPGTYTLVITDETTGCTSALDSVLVKSLAYAFTPTLTASNVLTCEQETATLLLTLPDDEDAFEISWLNAAGEVIAENTTEVEITEGDFITVNVVDIASGCPGTANLLVEEDRMSPTLLSGTATDLTCQDSEATLSVTVMTEGAPFVVNWLTPSLEWLTDQGTEITHTEPGVYEVQIINVENGCITQTTLTVEDEREFPPVAITSSGVLDCRGESVSLTGNTAPQGSSWTYAWSRNGTIVSNAPQIDVTESGVYTLLITDLTNGCTGTLEEAVVSIDNGPSALSVLAEDESCEGENDGSLFIDSIEGGTGPFTYTVDGNPLDGTDFLTDLAPGQYEIVAADQNGCAISQLVDVQAGTTVGVELLGENVLELGDELRLRALPFTSGQTIIGYDWTLGGEPVCPGCTDVLEVDGIFSRTEVSVLVTDENGCTGTAVLPIFLDKGYQVYAPNVFSPNGDGRNDGFTLFGNQEVDIITKLMVLDRWGNMVFDGVEIAINVPAEGWDGTFRDKLAGQGTYVYVATVRFIDGTEKMFKGDVTLIR